jgi:PIN domain nuclease of toxin-antitoxin system
MSAVLDTHTAPWYLENSKELSALAYTTIEEAIRDGRHVRVSAISVIEAVCLVDALEKIPRSVVPDMPDRFIAATALHLGVPLVTRDRRLQSAGIQTIW